ncbi:hypothetical protein LSCM1_03326 [Leishmania martiniquensis]|uniref:Uncharacterized protein n=1 Tax=Leishmania martiniquensis TaxID=1580590 RepID=A0A836GIV5_9TRYP|nr:hypothetical protein LSCM1_03326 [Leishmania martiniquensis]
MPQTFGQVLLECLEAAPRVPRRDRQKLLLKELMFLNTLQAIRVSDGAPEEGAEQLSWQDNHTQAAAKVGAALRCALLQTVDIADARRIAESLSVSTDADLLYRALDTECIMSLHVSGDSPRRPAQQLRGVEVIVDELSEFQESVLLLRVGLPWSTGGTGAAASSPTPLGCVAQVKSWVENCMTELEVGTQVTYYADADCSHAFFDVRSAFIFSPDGTKVEHISRELLPRGGHDVHDVLRRVRFGSFSAL